MKRGRPTKYNSTLVNDILNAISKGMTQKDACSLVGIEEHTLIEWKNTKPEFSTLLRKKEVEYKRKLIKGVDKAKPWQSKAWMLERKYSDEYAVKTKVDVKHEFENPPDIEEVKKRAGVK